ncbi:MAG: xanthine dehydrogenase family protein molybdopterin-binding subunit, partial [Anaerolineae bacterium]
MSEHRYVGNPELRRVDGVEKVTGRARFVGDMVVPGMLVAKVLRSPLPHARIAELDVSSALAVPGVKAVITHADFVDHGNFGWPVRDAYILAYHKVRYVGEPVAVVAAETAEAAQAGVEAIAIVYEPLPVVTTPGSVGEMPPRAGGSEDRDVADLPDALVGAPQIPEVSPTGKGNLCATHILRHGEPDPLLAAAPVVFEATYDLPHQEHAYLETEGALAIPEPDGSVTLYANSQSPHINRDTTVQVLGLPQDRVRVIQPPVGGAFGGKDDVLYQTSAQAAKLALITGRPVRLILTRPESMSASYKRQAMQIHLRLGADEDGTLRAAKARLLADSGAYASMTPMTSWRATMHAAGAYRYEAVHVDTWAVYTNNGYAGAFRGFGNTQASAAIELAIDELAERLGRDPLDFRLQNCLRLGDQTMTGDVLDQAVGLSACLEWVRDRSDWTRKRSAYGSSRPPSGDGDAWRRGIGVACYFHGSGLGGEGEDFATATMAIEPDHTITLTSGLTDYGQGSRTVFTLLAAETLGVAIERIRMLRPDTQTALDSGPTVASRASIVGGNAVRVTAQKLARTLDFAAADFLGCAPEQLIRDGERYIGPNEELLAFETVVDHARAMGLQLSAQGRWQVRPIEWDFERGTGEPYFCYVFGAQVAEVEVNRRTGRTRVRKIWAAHDAGTILYPQGAMGQMYGGIAQGLGYALSEAFRYVDGVPQQLDFDRYRIPRARDVPEIEGTYIQTSHSEGPYGAKNLAEPVMIATAPAIANAYAHATGRRVRGFPLPRRPLEDQAPS